ncbi:MAG: type II toxin-antitoxin system HigB family toxin [Muribaculaceae bacterium]|nr:type II toxin-antitoxin system HigB family toxin [Muribaculaceae bacterium]
MNIVAKKTLVDYYLKNPQSKEALEDWYTKTRRSQWTNFADVRSTFNSVDAVGNQHYVFNIKGNDFRLIVVIQFKHRFVYIRFVGTHAEYDKLKDASQV